MMFMAKWHNFDSKKKNRSFENKVKEKFKKEFEERDENFKENWQIYNDENREE